MHMRLAARSALRCFSSVAESENKRQGGRGETSYDSAEGCGVSTEIDAPSSCLKEATMAYGLQTEQVETAKRRSEKREICIQQEKEKDRKGEG